jgi:hypothetical protein
MLAMITTEEYKELILKEQECEQMKLDFIELAEEEKELKEKLGKTQEKLEGLLNCITSGQEPRWEEEYRSYDLADNLVISDYINKNFVKDGKLNVKGNDNND